MNIDSPIVGSDTEDSLTHPVANPLNSRRGLVGFQRLADHFTHRGEHVGLELEQPLLDLSSRLGGRDHVLEEHDLALARFHVRDLERLGELDRGDALEALSQMRLHSSRIFRLREYLEKLFVRQEKEASKKQTLLFQIRIQTFED